MKCANIYCVFWNNNQCIFDNIEIDVNGHCDLYKHVEISDTQLQNLRKEERKHLVPFDDKYIDFFQKDDF